MFHVTTPFAVYCDSCIDVLSVVAGYPYLRDKNVRTTWMETEGGMRKSEKCTHAVEPATVHSMSHIYSDGKYI